MKEIEVKILEVNRKEIEKKLLGLEAKKVFDDCMEAFYFDDEEGSLKKKGVILRVRKEAGEVYLFVKSNVSKEIVKSADEKVVKVESFDAIEEILGVLGFFVKGIAKKKRVMYKAGGASFCFDKYQDDLSFIPEFFEVEAGSEEEVLKYVKLLGFRENDCRSWSLSELIKNYKK